MDYDFELSATAGEAGAEMDLFSLLPDKAASMAFSSYAPSQTYFNDSSSTDLSSYRSPSVGAATSGSVMLDRRDEADVRPGGALILELMRCCSSSSRPSCRPL
jgi:hypothetical protein